MGELKVWRRMRLVLCQRDGTSLALMRLVKSDRKCLTTFKGENGCQASVISVTNTRLRYLDERIPQAETAFEVAFCAQTRRGSSSHSLSWDKRDTHGVTVCYSFVFRTGSATAYFRICKNFSWSAYKTSNDVMQAAGPSPQPLTVSSCMITVMWWRWNYWVCRVCGKHFN